MYLAKYRTDGGPARVGRVEGQELVPVSFSQNVTSLSDILEQTNPRETAMSLSDTPKSRIPLSDVQLLAPIDFQEVWAAGVTYVRSKAARMEESESAASCYDRVYEAARPELFLKATPHRVVGPNQPIRIRQDSQWNVPEPELTLVLNSRNEIVGFTVGNDVSSRDIEGENPLYLPQAKVYDQSCAIGPWITLADTIENRSELSIILVVRRNDSVAFQGKTSIARMARSFEDLVRWLTLENSFPQGAFLMTGTGVVPDPEFTLKKNDLVDITIDQMGTLSNPVVQR